MPKKILLQTTIPYTEDDWHIARFSLLHETLGSVRDAYGNPAFEITARNLDTDENGNDKILSDLHNSDFDQVWLFAVDTGNGLTDDDCEAITRFRQRGGGIFSTRDHFDLGSSLCTLGGVGAAHYFHSKHPDPDPERHIRDDQGAPDIDYPNYHSGSNGDYQMVTIEGDLHELLKRPDGSAIEHFPAHPHEGGVGSTEDDNFSRVIATGRSKTTGRSFNLLVALDECEDKHGNRLGRAIAASSFHHLVDYNWDTDMGCPSFLEEPPGWGCKEHPHKLDDIKIFAANAAKWLSRG